MAGVLGAAFMLLGSTSFADQKDSKEAAPPSKTAKPKPYQLKTCIVTDEKLGGDMGEPYTFTYKDREVKMCCKDCRTDFDKNPAKYIKKLEAEEKKAAEAKKPKQ